MTNRYRRLDRVFNYRLSRERLYQQRAAICCRWLHAAQQRLTQLHEAACRVQGAAPPGKTAAARWHQDRQHYLRALHRRIFRLERLGEKLRQRLQYKRNQATTAGQYRRATESALARLQQEVNQTLIQNKDKEFHQLVRLEFLNRRLNANAATTRG